jgi:phospholipid/cholesterol/gamma-HCH transport system substrate-binding protein
MRFKNEVLVGIVVLVGLIIIAGGAIWLSGRPWAQQQATVVAMFREVGELRQGNPLVYRGVPVGRVTRIELLSTGNAVLVTMEMSPDVQLPPDPGVVLAPQSLFGDWQAQLVSRQMYPELVFTPSSDPGILPGTTLPDISQLTAVAARIATDIETLAERIEIAFTEETARNIARTVDNVQEISAQLSGFVDAQTVRFDQVAQNVLSASNNIERTTARVDRVASQVEQAVDQGDIQAILTNARLASESLRMLGTQMQDVTTGVPALMARADTTLVAISGLITGLQPATAEAGTVFVEARNAMATLQRILAQVEQGEGTIGRLIEDPALYEETQRAITTLRRILADIQENPGRYIGQVRIF